MANFHAIMRLRPEVRDYVRHGGWTHRGDVVTYLPDRTCAAFSSGPDGFRHSICAGETLSVQECLERPRYGLVLGSSHVFGFGLPGNERTIPSVLGDRFGFPFANLGLPEASSRNLFSLLAAITASAAKPPAIVLHLSGGDFTSFCYTAIADPVFGSPNMRQFAMAIQEHKGRPDPATQIKPMLASTTLWVRAIAQLCRTRRIPFVLGNDTTFFEKAEPGPSDLQCKLGQPAQPSQQLQFATHKAFIDQFLDRRSVVAQRLGVPLAGPGPRNRLGFIDEFHYDSGGVEGLCDDFAKAIDPLLQ